MSTLQEPSVSLASADTPMYWHFRALPLEVQRDAIRRLALRGLGENEIAVRTGWSVDAVRRAVQEDECVARLAPTRGAPPQFGVQRQLHAAQNSTFRI